MQTHRFGYRAEIDGLRAVAVVAVVVFHAVPSWLPGGFVGVDVFFVISGYLITSLLAAEHGATGRLDVGAFFARRVCRLLPTLLTVVTATVALSVWLGPAGDFGFRVAESASASLLFVANVYFHLTSGGYFDGPTDQMPLLHLWSLGVEEQFYLLFPIVLVFLLRRGRETARNSILLACVLSFAAAEATMPLQPQASFYVMPLRFWELGVGAMLALVPRRDLGPTTAGWLTTIGLVVIASATWWRGTIEHFPASGALPAISGSMLVLAATHGSTPGGAGVLLRSRPLVAIGLVSYGFYLWHWPLLAIDRAAMLGEPPASRRVLFCLVALLLATATYRWVERPARSALSLRPRRVLQLAGVVIMTGLVTLHLAARDLETPSVVAMLAAAARADRPESLRECHYDVFARVETLKPPSCQSRSGPAELALWGDSHALAWQPFAWELARSQGVAGRMMTMDSCTPVRRFSAERSDAPAHRENCQRFNAMAIDEMQRGDYRTVIIAARWLGLFPQEPGIGSARGRRPMPPAVVERELEAAIGALAGVPEILLMMPPPESPHDAYGCIASRREQQCAQTRVDVESKRRKTRAVLVAIASRHRNVTVVDPIDFFCDADACPLRRDELVFYWDDNHVSATASRAFGLQVVSEPGAYRIRGGPDRVEDSFR